ncbi:BTAD domain-containing putative transcriptional regulator [Actinoplanes xinjiangensis]|uniref:Putative ATPase n=1 Tax=Actinoplanes xinjiangensis TaxID=512350 RepID=A0A316FIA6_9ACTN|nr:BTAD domain-containing putative transcriptional regulator [Actinoplanes xinjiangensis]PWK47456.1 putative ATPase [Actinoplanes xinjiangensis]GIF39615.1 SARP family transcriptional regulator [Actinoplanes xinjiangensis]
MQIGILGPFEVRTDGGTLADVPGARLRGLLTALALEPGRVVSKAMLVDRIWGSAPPADATNALHRLVSRLRKTLPDGTIEGLADGYRLAVEPGAVDAVRFERLLTAGRARPGDDPERVRLLREALNLWRGAALQDVDPPDHAAVARLEEMRLAALEERFEAEIRLCPAGDQAALIAELTGLVTEHPLRERLAAALMRALATAGRGNEALQVYQRTREALAGALGVDPSPELAALHVTLLRGDGDGRAPARRTNLRAELTSYVGKSADIAAVRELVTGHRLITLIGPGGTGKTRLAVESGRTLVDDVADGVWLVELAPLGAGGDVAQATIAGLGLRDALLGAAPNADLTDRIVAAVRDREMLLILDNCEHLIDQAAAFAHRMLGECARLRILATSREPLGITGETLWQVEPLDMGSAVRLLRDRAAAVGRPGDDDTATPARVCRALDGMPLAIELAAARLRTMTLDQLAHRLDDRFRLLTGGSRTALPRHRTLRAVVDWSWDLLTDDERTALCRLSVFAGGASLEAAERVGADLDLLTSLAEKSLLVTVGGDAPRYRMLGTIREYAAQRLAEAGQSEPARLAHLAYFTELAETAEPRLRRADQLEWLARLEADHDDLGAAMRGALAAGETVAAMRLAAAAGWYWWLSGRKTEGSELLRAALSMPGEVPDRIRATVYALMSMYVNSGMGDEHQAAEWIRQAYRFSRGVDGGHPLIGFVVPLERMLREPGVALSAFEPLLHDDDPWARALARLHLGKMRIVLGHDGPDTDVHLKTALAEFRALGERFGISFALGELAERLAGQGEFAEACGHYEQAVEVVTQVGSTEDVIRLRARQAQLYWLMGDRDTSAAALAEAQRLAEQVTWPGALAVLAFGKAELARWSGDRAEAYRQVDAGTALLGDEAQWPNIRAGTHDLLGYLAEDPAGARAERVVAYRSAVEAGHATLIAQVLVGVADLALRDGDHAQAARLLAAAVAVRGRPDRSHPEAGRIEETARRRLGEPGFAEATEEGAAADWRRLAEATLAG